MKTQDQNRENQLLPELIDRFKHGEITAFEEVYYCYFHRVFHFSCKLTPNNQDAEEITQDVFVKLWQKRVTIDSEKNLTNFLFTIAKNLVIDKMRQYAAIDKKFQQLRNVRQQERGQSNHTEQLVNYYELSEILEKLINQLPNGRRTIYKLSREKGFKNVEIAEFLNISVGTVEKQLSNALHTLSNALKEKYGIMVDLAVFLGIVFF